jgi:predicted pyridoxine 5'-phosphate oxidase superfamily flavin-nucleotide-binding protein
MGILTDDMRRVLSEQQLGFIATVTPDGKPNLSPKGTTAALDGDHLVFADICSPNTVRNLASNPAIEINVVDPIRRKGYRFKGAATVFAEGPRFEEILAFIRARGALSPIRHVVLVKVESAAPLISPAYDLGRTEAEVIAQWEQRHDDLRRRRESSRRSDNGR